MADHPEVADSTPIEGGGQRSASSSLREMVVIVASILIAFGLDAGWDRMRVRTEIESELRNLQLELRENEEQVAGYLEWHRRTEVASEDFLELLRGDATGVGDVAIPDPLIWGIGFTPMVDASTGAIDALVSSGRLALIPDGDLRRAIAGLGGHLADARSEELRARNYTDAQLLDVLMRSADVSRATLANLRDDDVPPEAYDIRTTVRNSMELRNRLARRLLFSRLAVQSLEIVRDKLDELARLVDGELGGG